MDQVLTPQLDMAVANLIFGLRKQYIRHKYQFAGRKTNKNYVFGIKEVIKHVEAK